MLGWNISVYRLVGVQPRKAEEQLAEGVTQPLLNALAALDRGERLAVWQAEVDGLAWIEGLVARGEAVGSIGSGYPGLFFAQARHVLPGIRSGPPLSRAVWSKGRDDVILPHWEGRTVIEEQTLRGCAPDEWLRIEVWDES